ncbi:MAG: hypothetical protein N4A33_02445 [Bacteriovoracaceae bacterium]|jgi:hypothetical protein|nr:hypothetical protein [Bacteriovoracaceae bacterium]
MKKILLLLTVCFCSIAQAQVGINISGGLPNGVELGVDYKPVKLVRIGGNFGSTKYTNNLNLKVSVGLPFIYAYGAINRLSMTSISKNALSDMVNETFEAQLDMSDATQKHLYDNALKTNSSDFHIVDIGLSGGLGFKAGWFFLEGGLRTTKLKTIMHNKTDLFLDRVNTYISDNYNTSDPQYYALKDEVANVRSEVHTSINEGAAQLPGQLKYLPELKIGVRIPIGKK